ncbi:MAG: formate dehydrogenase accessory protein FdhE [Nitrospirae bacterium]|nr:formate dehydrogenase accessory protein FdhE [Nitrospirota bacterium]MBE0428037.1 formate dehydrogenase accessory protein FdhE [Nitrospirota bacterium]
MKRKKPNELDRIIQRIDVIEKKRPSHKEVLEFLKDIVKQQYKIKPLINVEAVDINKEMARLQLREGFSLIDKKDIKLNMDTATTLFKKICRAIQRKNKKIAPEIKKINQALRKNEIELEEIFKRLLAGDNGYLDSIGEKTGLNKWLLISLAKSSIIPFFEAYADRLKGYVELEPWFRSHCPVCGSEPLMGELRTVEGVEGVKFLVCSSCSYEWRFKRLACPFCGNSNHEKLRYFHTDADGKAYRVDVCEECKKYIKTIDLRELRMDVIPVVEDMGTLHLDIIAQKEGYKRGVSGILEIEELEE